MVGSMYRLVSPPPCTPMSGTCWTAFGLQGGDEGDNEMEDDVENDIPRFPIFKYSIYLNILYIISL